ncbi:hypothetical protein LTR75_018047 [Friedmanniomyces endolithicus]|nr:hypothetical protein LTR75_018047 [Friedmanniomyces endolithicus]
MGCRKRFLKKVFSLPPQLQTPCGGQNSPEEGNFLATASRQLWSFARDGGLPFSKFLEPVPDAEVPRRAVWTTIAFTLVLSCVNFGPVVGFNAIISLVIVSLTFSYFITISCLASTVWS